MTESLMQKNGDKEQRPALTETYISLSKDPRIWSDNLTDVLQFITRTCAEALKIAHAGVWQMQAENQQMQCLVLYRSGQYIDVSHLEVVDIPEYYRTLNEERLIDVSHALTDPRLQGMEPYLQRYNIHSLLDAIIRVKGEIVGILCFESVAHCRLWNDYEKNFLTSVADLVGQLFTISALRDSENRYKALFDDAGDAIFVLHNNRFITCNTAAESMFGYTNRQFQQLASTDISPSRQPDGRLSAQHLSELMLQAQQTTQRFEWQHCRANGNLFDTDVTLKGIMLNNTPCLMAIVRDITERKHNERMLAQSRQELEYLAHHDSLTGLANRSKLHEQVASKLKQPASDYGLALMLLDLNRFKEVNDTLGHRLGDQLLKKVAAELAKLLTPYQAELFRLGGDEFAILTEAANPLTLTEEAIALSRAICDSLRQPKQIENIRLALTGSIGIACYPQHGSNSHDLLRCADVAMYHAKANSLGPTLYNSEFDSYSPKKLALMSDLNSAINSHQLQLYFQPKIHLGSGSCIGSEALLRWLHPQHGIISPDNFIPAAEMSDLIHPLSQWVLQQAIQQCRQWLDNGIRLPVAVNLSSRNLIDQQCAQLAKELLQQFDLPAELLEIEITESALINDPKRAMEVLQQFRQLGVNIAIDDFGTGYSSLSYLKKLPIQTLKIDRSFVQDMLTDPADAVIVSSTISLAHSFGLQVVAEGVENDQVLAALRHYGCDQAQGYYISRPLPAEAFSQWLKVHRQ